MHTTSGRWSYGLFLALLTALLWGILPIKLKQVLQVVDPITVTWYRLLVSGGLLFAWLAAKRRLPSFTRLAPRGKGLVVVAVLGLMGNYVLYLIGLNLLSPGTAQLVVQVGPVLLLVASVFVFRERFSLGQGVGLVILLAGFGLFFNERLEELLTSLGTYTTGVLTILLATSIWVFYALSQKQLLTVWHSQQVMMVIYLSCAALLTPWVHPLEALQLTPVQELAAAGLLPEYPGGLRRICRGAGALGGVAGECHPGVDTAGDALLRWHSRHWCGRSMCTPRTSQCPGLCRGGDRGVRLGRW